MNAIKISKGLNIHLIGEAPESLLEAASSESYAIVPDHFSGISPKVLVKVGDRLNAGAPLMMDKKYPEIKFVSPVSGEVIAVNRGAKRKVLSLVVKPDAEMTHETFDVKDPLTMSAEEVKTLLLESGMWPFIKQRPYDIVASPAMKPRDIFVTSNDTAPLAPSFNFLVKGDEEAYQMGLNVLTRLTEGDVYLGVAPETTFIPKHVKCTTFHGPHPSGNVGVMINQLKPVNKGEVVWTLNGADVITIGRLFLHGKVDFTRVIALTGAEMEQRGYVKAIAGCTIGSLIGDKVKKEGHIRTISGNVLTGIKVSSEDYLGFYHHQITAIPEGDDVDEFLGWGTLGFNKYSVSRTYFSWILGRNKQYNIDARIRGGKRAMIMSNEYDRVFPMDIFPEFLLKAIIAFDVDKMENLGVYEVAPEDFALCEFVDTSKIEIQRIVRQGLDLLYKEMN